MAASDLGNMKGIPRPCLFSSARMGADRIVEVVVTDTTAPANIRGAERMS